MMRHVFLSMFLAGTVAGAAAAQTRSQAGSGTGATTLRIGVDDAVRMALDHNVDLAADRIDPQISDMRVAAATGAFKPTLSSSVNRNNQLQPPSSFLIPTATRNDVVGAQAGVGQRLPWFGTSYSASWTATHTDSNSFLSAYDPLVQSGLGFSVSQPLLRDRAVDASRLQLTTSRVNRQIADLRLRESVVHTTAAVKAAYWGLVAAQANVTARRTALDLAQELERVNKAKVDVGQSPPLDLVSAQAEVAANQEQLIIAETAVRQAEDRLRLLILDPSEHDTWTAVLDPIDSPNVATPAFDLDAAVAGALHDRVDLLRARKDIENAASTVKFAGNQRLPDVRVNASYQANGLGGTQVLRTGGFPGTIVGPGDSVGFGSVLDQLFRRAYPTWAVGVSVNYPIGGSVEEANSARTRLEYQQAVDRLKSAEGRVVQQVRDAAWKVDMNARRIETTRAARQFAEQRLDAEQKRFDVGMSTSFLVIQAQRDFAQANTNLLSSVLAYELSLIDFEELQQAGPAAASAAPTAAAASAAAAVAGSTAVAGAR